MKLIDNIYVFSSAKELDFELDNNESILNQYVYEKIKNCVENKKNDVLLFKIVLNNEETLSVYVNKKDLIKPLNKCIERFQILEEYEKCSDCLKLIDSINDEM